MEGNMSGIMRKVAGRIKVAWNTWPMTRKLILAGIAVTIVGIAVLSKPVIVPVIAAPVTDEAARGRIVTRINQEGVTAIVSSSGVVSVGGKETARKMRTILIMEDLIPQGTDPWDVFDWKRWTITDFERDVNFRRRITAMVTAHIESLDDVDNANVAIVVPGWMLFVADLKPVTASVILTLRPGSDIRENRKKIEGIQRIFRFAVAGLIDENIVITDGSGLVLNDFEEKAGSDGVAVTLTVL
jgi:flagellar M-ring protein FliF